VKLEEESEAARDRKTVDGAVTAFLEHCEVAYSTFQKYSGILNKLCTFAKGSNVRFIHELNLVFLDAYRQHRKVCALTWSKELQLLRNFSNFCIRRKWMEENAAKDMKMPRDPKPRQICPYMENEVESIIAACDEFGRSTYERTRAKAMILLMRYYAFRVSDVATLRRDRIQNGQIYFYAMKNGVPLWMPLNDRIKEALEQVPRPKGASPDCDYYFWTGSGSREVHVRTVERTLLAVFRKSKVPDAHAHRFRHTLATEILATGGIIEDAANIVGDSPATIRKHYAKWSLAYQERTVEVLSRVHDRHFGTSMAHRKKVGVSPLSSTDNLVRMERLELSRPFGLQILSLVRLPISPHPHVCRRD
jgi:integrase/recombinase XerC